MINKSPCSSGYLRLLVLLLSCFLQHAGYAADPISLPSAATPGGATPRTGEASPAAGGAPNIFLIPPVIDRPLGLQEGDRLLVRRFSLRGVIDHPKFGIYADEVRGIVEQLRQSRQKIDKTIVNGFTDKELSQGAELLRKLVDRPSDQLS